MAKRKLPEIMKKTQFKKGQVANPHGARVHDVHKRKLKKLTIETYREVIELVLTGNIEAMQGMIKDPATPAIQVGVATAFLKAIRNGDYEVIEKIAERIVGKIPDELNVNARNLNANLNSAIDPVKLREALKQLEADV